MNQKVTKSKKQSGTKWKSLRVSAEMKANSIAKLKEINAKNYGRNLKLDEMLSLALERLTEADVKLLHDRSLSNSDRQELLRLKYSELYSPVTPEEFIGVTMTPAYFDFLKEHGHIIAAT